MDINVATKLSSNERVKHLRVSVYFLLKSINTTEFENKYWIFTSNLKSNQLTSYQMPGIIYRLIFRFVTKKKICQQKTYLKIEIHICTSANIWEVATLL